MSDVSLSCHLIQARILESQYSKSHKRSRSQPYSNQNPINGRNMLLSTISRSQIINVTLLSLYDTRKREKKRERYIYIFIHTEIRIHTEFVYATRRCIMMHPVIILFLFHPRYYYKLSLCAPFSNTFDNSWKSWKAYAQWRMLYKLQYDT